MKRDLKVKILFFSLMSAGVVSTNIPRKNLLEAIREQNTKKVRDLIKEGAQVNVKSIKRGEIPLIFTAQLAKTKKDDRKMAIITKELLKSKANPTVKDRLGITPLILAAKNGADRVLQALLNNKKAQATINMQDRNGNTALIQAAMAAMSDKRKVYITITKRLLKKDANPNIKNKQGKTAFFYAKQAGNTKIMDLLRSYMPKGPKLPITPTPKLRQKPTRKYRRPNQPITTMPIPPRKRSVK